MSFVLDTRLAADTIEIGDLALSTLRLMDDSRFLWFVLVPRRANLSELIDLDAASRAMLIEEIAALSKALAEVPGVDKINVGALGNIVRQLHVHVVGRRIGDAAWPGPVWGAGAPRRYDRDQAAILVQEFHNRLIRNTAS